MPLDAAEARAVACGNMLNIICQPVCLLCSCKDSLYLAVGIAKRGHYRMLAI